MNKCTFKLCIKWVYLYLVCNNKFYHNFFCHLILFSYILLHIAIC